MAAKAPRVRSRTEARGRRVLSADRARSSTPLARLLIDGRAGDVQIGDRLQDAGLARTIEGPNILTLTTWNGDRAVTKSDLLGRRTLSRVLRVELDGLGFIATGLSKSGDQAILSLEDEQVTKLKRHGRNSYLRFIRGEWTRAQACAHMIRQAGVPVIVLDENTVVQITGADKLKSELRKARSEARGETKKTRKSAKGVSGVLTVKGKRATSEQRRNVEKALKVADDLGASDRPRAAMMVAGIAEGQFVTARKNGSGSGATGPFQIMPDTARGLGISATDVPAAARYFLDQGFRGRGGGAIAIARQNPGWTIGQIADAVEGGGAGAAFYDEWHDEALEWIKAAGGGKITGGTDSGTAWIKQFAFERLKTESTWACCWRLLVEEAKWRLFVREGVVIIASDPALMRAAPSLEITEHSDAVENIDYDWHRAQRVQEMTATAYIGRWTADPGEVAYVPDMPVADQQRWLIATVDEPFMDTTVQATISLRTPQNPADEPASEVAQSSGDDTSNGDRNGHGLVYPLADHGKNGGGVAAHKGRAWGNWQSDNAVDILVSQGTKVYAVDDGEIVKLGGHWDGTGQSNPNGYNITLKTGDNEWFYTHLRSRSSKLTVGGKVKAGQLVGESGAANGVAHLHIASEHGDPEKLLDV